ncbi:MAG: zf-TFIIB domain-containing protein [Planctomycetia bacterium]|jgi:Zn-finger nucleic acid-binding protein
MKCPVCKTDLKRIFYEGMAVFRCFGCAGYLMQEKRLESIRIIPQTPVELLKKEVIEEQQPDTLHDIKCPHCFYPMTKVQLPPPASLMIDLCTDCQYVWLDGGELARIQLAYECSDIGREHRELRRRFEALTPKERELLQRRINKLQTLNPSDEGTWNGWNTPFGPGMF